MTEVKEYRTEWTPQELAAEIAGIIRLKRGLWNQRQWFGEVVSYGSLETLRALLEDDAEPACGTTACVAGWASVLSMPGDTVIRDSAVRMPDGRWREAEDVGQVALGLFRDERDWLFSGARSEAEVLRALDAITAGGELPEFKTFADPAEPCGCGCGA